MIDTDGCRASESFLNRSPLNFRGRDLYCVPRPASDFHMTFTIRASKNGETIETVRIGPTAAVAKARGLFKTGWLVWIVDSDGSTYAPSEFDQLLSFDRPKGPKESSNNDILAMVEDILADRRGSE
jgi:hypothetical protein